MKGTEQDAVLQAMRACAAKFKAPYHRFTVTRILVWMDNKIPKPAIVKRLRILEKRGLVRRVDNEWALRAPEVKP